MKLPHNDTISTDMVFYHNNSGGRGYRRSHIDIAEPQIGIEPTKGFHPFQFTKLGP